MKEEVEELVAKIVAYLSEDERYSKQIPLTVESIQDEFSVKEAEVAHMALLQLADQWALVIEPDGKFRYKPPHPPVLLEPPPPNSPDARRGPEPVRTTNPDIRPYQQDLQRILFSSAFRRLAGVTQVFETRRGHMVLRGLSISSRTTGTGST